jgi:hypothetical protein
VAAILRLTAVPGDPPIVVVPTPVRSWQPTEMGFNAVTSGPIRVNLEFSPDWGGTEDDAQKLTYDVLDAIIRDGGYVFRYQFGWLQEGASITVRVLPGTTAADVAIQVLSGSL